MLTFADNQFLRCSSDRDVLRLREGEVRARVGVRARNGVRVGVRARNGVRVKVRIE